MNRRRTLGLAVLSAPVTVLLRRPRRRVRSTKNGDIALSAVVRGVPREFMVEPNGTGLWQITRGRSTRKRRGELSVVVVSLLALAAGARTASGAPPSRYLRAGATTLPHTASSNPASAILRRRPELDTWSGDPRLGVRARTDISVHVSDTGPEVGKVTLYVPGGYGLNLTAPPGTKEGHVFLLTGSDIGVGELTAVDPAAYDATQEAQACAPGPHATVWVMPLDCLISSATTAVPIYVDPTTGPETALGAYKLQTCLPLAIIPSPGGWPIGSRPRDLTFEFTRFTNPGAAGVYTWRAFASYPNPSGDPDSSTTYELRSDMPLPAQLTLTGRFDRKRGHAVLSGRLTTQTFPASGIRIALYRVSRQGTRWHVATTLTAPNGLYHFVRPEAKTSTYLTETAGVGDCTSYSTAPRGCVDETRGAIDSSPARVAVHHRRSLNLAPEVTGRDSPRQMPGQPPADPRSVRVWSPL